MEVYIKTAGALHFSFSFLLIYILFYEIKRKKRKRHNTLSLKKKKFGYTNNIQNEDLNCSNPSLPPSCSRCCQPFTHPRRRWCLQARGLRCPADNSSRIRPTNYSLPQ